MPRRSGCSMVTPRCASPMKPMSIGSSISSVGRRSVATCCVVESIGMVTRCATAKLRRGNVSRIFARRMRSKIRNVFRINDIEPCGDYIVCGLDDDIKSVDLYLLMDSGVKSVGFSFK